MPEYTAMTALSIVAVVVVECCWLRTGVFRTAQYWWSMAIVAAFQIPVDGLLTKLSNPTVIYDDAQTLGIRAPWDIPIEDFGFGFAMVTLAIVLWHRRTRGRAQHAPIGLPGTDALPDIDGAAAPPGAPAADSGRRQEPR